MRRSAVDPGLPRQPRSRLEHAGVGGCRSLDAQDKQHGFAALDSGRWLGPAYAFRHHGRVKFKHAVGVVLYVPARPGLSAPWLHRAAECRVEEESRSGSGRSPFSVAGTEIEVQDAKTGYLVRITAEEHAAADELVRRISG